MTQRFHLAITAINLMLLLLLASGLGRFPPKTRRA